MLLSVVLTMLALPPCLYAQPSSNSLSPQARIAISTGLSAVKLGAWDVAADSFDEARKLAPNAAGILFYQGLAESHLPGRELRAIVLYKAYLGTFSNAPNARSVENEIATLKTSAKSTTSELISSAISWNEDNADLVSHDLLESRLARLVYYQSLLGDLEGALTLAYRVEQIQIRLLVYSDIIKNLVILEKFDDAKRVADLINDDGRVDPNQRDLAFKLISEAQAEATLSNSKLSIKDAKDTARLIKNGPLRNSELAKIAAIQQHSDPPFHWRGHHIKLPSDWLLLLDNPNRSGEFDLNEKVFKALRDCLDSKEIDPEKMFNELDKVLRKMATAYFYVNEGFLEVPK